MSDNRSYSDDKKKTILYVIGSLEVGGTEKQLCRLMSRVLHLPYYCYVFKLQRGDSLCSRCEDFCVPIYDFGMAVGDTAKKPWKVILAELKLMRIVNYLKPDILHSFLPLVTFMGSLAGRVGRVPLIINSRRSLAKYLERQAILKPIDALADRMSHIVTVNSRAVWDDAVHGGGLDPNKVVLIHNGIDSGPFESVAGKRLEARQELGISQHDKVIITVANLIPYKGHVDLLEAVPEVLKQIPNTVFLLVGENRGIQKELEKKVAALGIFDRVRFVGLRNDVPMLMAASDISVLPSHEEGFSNVILESMAAELPVVTTRVGGNPEAVVDGMTGWLVPPRKPKELAIKIIDLLSNPERGKAWGRNGRKRVKEIFPVDKMVEKYVWLYENSSGKKL